MSELLGFEFFFFFLPTTATQGYQVVSCCHHNFWGGAVLDDGMVTEVAKTFTERGRYENVHGGADSKPQAQTETWRVVERNQL